MQKITKAMMDNAIAAYTRTLAAHELLDGDLSYQTGNASYGYAWTLRYAETGCSPVGVDMGFLGSTAREAYDRLHAIIRVLNDIKFRNEAL